MKKADIIAKIQGKVGIHSFVDDKPAPDNIQNDVLQKHYFLINNLNADGTMGKTYVYYLLDTVTGDCFFYNTEVETLDIKDSGTEQKRIINMKKYLENKYFAFFTGATYLETGNAFIEATVFVLNVDKLTKKNVIVFKKGATPINDYDVI